VRSPSRSIDASLVSHRASKLILTHGRTFLLLLTCKKNVRFEGLEYAGILKGARRSTKDRHALARARDCALRTADGIRHDVRAHMSPAGLRRRWTGSMERDKPGTVGFATGAFLGFVL
jgi:hypothetical protein